MNYLKPEEELAEIKSEIAVKEYVAVRLMKQTQEIVDEINALKEDRELVQKYVDDHPSKPECAYGPCDRDARSRGYCGGHYKQVIQGRPLSALQGSKDA